MKPLKIFNTLILIGFLAYWGFVFYSFTQGKTQWWNTLYEQLPVRTTMPPVYRMYTSPPKSNVLVKVRFYANNELVGTENTDVFFKEFRKNNFLRYEDIKLKYTREELLLPLYYAVVNNMYDYYEMEIDSISMQEFLLSRRGSKAFFGNQKLLPKVMQKYKPEYMKADSFELDILRYPIELKMDEHTKDKFSYWIKDTLAYNTSGKL